MSKPWEKATTETAPVSDAPTVPDAPTPDAPVPDVPAVPDAPAAPDSPAALDSPAPVETAGEVFVTVTVPKAFKLRLDDHTVVDYKAGVQDIPLAHCEHWWSKANGVVEYKGRKSE